MDTLSTTMTSHCGHGSLDSSGTLRTQTWVVPVSSTQQTPHRCPVCEGCGSVPPDFYTKLGSSTNANREPCRSCGGSGVLWR